MAKLSSSNGLEKRPKLRFPGFDEPWKTNIFDEIFSLLPNNTLSRADLTSCGDILNVHYGDVLIKYGSILDVESDEIPYITTGKESKKQCYLSDGDVIIADTAEDETVGKCTEIINTQNAKIEAGLHTIPCHPRTAYAPMFLGYYMNSPYYHKQLIPLMQGVKVLSVSKSNIGNTLISAPVSYSEQEKIVDLLHLLDCRMRKQQEVIDSLKKYKRGVMRAIFRDKSFVFSKATVWKSIRLGDECVFFSGGTPKSTDSSYYGGSIPFIRSGEIHGEKTELFLTEAGLQNSSAKMVSKGDLLIALYGATSGKVDISKIDGAINQAILCIRPYDMSKQYLRYLLEDSKDDIINTYLQGGQGNLSAEIIKNLRVDIPDSTAQSSVVEFLSMIERRIEMSIAECEQIQAMKRSSLQQLFI